MTQAGIVRLVGKMGKRVRVTFPNLEVGLAPWLPVKFKKRVYIWDRKPPFAADGFIDRNGNFFQCDAMRHDDWAHHLGVTQSHLTDKMGWITVLSYQSIFTDEPTPHFRFCGDPTKEQLRTMVDWCRARKIGMERAFGKTMFRYLFADADRREQQKKEG